MWGLEYAFYFGVPSNKIELLEGRSRWYFPFLSREAAERHFEDWSRTFARWKGVALSAPTDAGKVRSRALAGAKIELYPRPIRIELPMPCDYFHEAICTYQRRDFWAGQPERLQDGWDHFLNHQDVTMNVWSLLDDLSERFGGRFSSRTDIAISETAAVAPDAYYYAAGRTDIMIDGDYFRGAPDLVAEVLSPASRALDRGPRQEVYRKAGVRRLWLVDPELETLETLLLEGRAYRLTGTFRPGDRFATDLWPDEMIDVSALFQTQLKRRPESRKPEEPEPIPEWLFPPDQPIGLECMFLLGHPERRWEIWGNKGPSVLAFGSATEARARLAHFLEEASRWEERPVPALTSIDPDVDTAEVGRFSFTRRGRLVQLDLSLDARKYVELLHVWGKREAWDWGEK